MDRRRCFFKVWVLRLLLYVSVICGEEVILNDLDADFNIFAHCMRQMDEKWKVVSILWFLKLCVCVCMLV